MRRGLSGPLPRPPPAPIPRPRDNGDSFPPGHGTDHRPRPAPAAQCSIAIFALARYTNRQRKAAGTRTAQRRGRDVSRDGHVVLVEEGGGEVSEVALMSGRREGGGNMAMKGLALHSWTLDTTPLTEVLRIARHTGWDAIELRRADFARAAEKGQSAAEVLDLVRASGLPVACVGVELGWMFAEGAERQRLLQACAESCGWAAALRCATVMSPVDPGRGDIERAVASIREVGDIAARHGVRLALEFNSQAEQFNTLERLRDVLVRAGHPHCALLLDTYHFQRSGGSPRALEDLASEEIAYVQYSDVPRNGLQPGKTTDRLPPGRGVVPFPEILHVLSEKRYSGYLSYEAPNPVAWARNPEEVAREALQATRIFLPGT
jgi:2-keto-myo-inositol isomerase